MVRGCKCLGDRALVLEVRSWSGNRVPMNLHQNTCYNLFRQERATSRGSILTLLGLGPGEGEGVPHALLACSGGFVQYPGLDDLAEEADLSWPGLQTLLSHHH